MKPLLFFCLFSLAFFSVKAQNVFNAHRDLPIPNPVPKQTVPQFPGGLKAYQKYLKKNLKWPSKEMDGQGRVIISFVVEINGRLTNIKVTKKMAPDFDKEALRVIKKMPRWEPATVNGKPIKLNYAIPINFTLIE